MPFRLRKANSPRDRLPFRLRKANGPLDRLPRIFRKTNAPLGWLKIWFEPPCPNAGGRQQLSGSQQSTSRQPAASQQAGGSQPAASSRQPADSKQPAHKLPADIHLTTGRQPAGSQRAASQPVSSQQAASREEAGGQQEQAASGQPASMQPAGGVAQSPPRGNQNVEALPTFTSHSPFQATLCPSLRPPSPGQMETKEAASFRSRTAPGRITRKRLRSATPELLSCHLA